MVYGSLLKNPKEEEEEQEVPHRNEDDDQIDDLMDDLEGFLGIEEDEEEFSELVSCWDFMDLEFPKEEKLLVEVDNVGDIENEINVGFWDNINEKEEEEKKLCLNLNYQEVLDAWSDRRSLWADHSSLSMAFSNNACYMGEVPVMEEERSSRREASVLRYKEKRQNRLFSKKIRYQVRKLNADKRQRLKGRFVKRSGS